MAPNTIDELQVLITAQTKGLRTELNKVNKQLSGLDDAVGKTSRKMFDGFERVGAMGTKALKVGVVGAIAAVAASIPGAVKRIDTLVAFPRVLEAMGASTEDAAKATQTLSDRLTGLPTPLQDGASGVQALVSAGLDIEGATDVFLAFNNATLAASTEAGAAQGAFTQLVQSISKGKIEGQEWNSMVSAMPTAFQALSKESGKTREELRELYRENPQKLLDDLVKLDKEGGGGLASLDDQARAATGGIGTAFANMRTSITRGLEGIVKQLGNGDLEAGQKKISDAITAIGKAFGDGLAMAGDFFAFLIRNSHIFGPIAAAITAMVAVLTAWHIITKLIAIAQGILNVVLMANPIGLIILAIVGLVAAFVYLWKTSEGFRNFFIKMWDKIKTTAQDVWDKISGWSSGAWSTIEDTWTAARDWFIDLWRKVETTVEEVITAIATWIEENKQAIINWGIVITTLLLPKIAQIGIAFGISAAQAIASFVSTAASAIVNAATTTTAWVVSSVKSAAAFIAQTPKMIAQFVLASASAVKNAAIVTASWVASAVTTAAKWVVSIGVYLAQLAIASAATLVAGGKMAVAWLLAMGPIGLIVAAVIGATALIIANWDTVKGWLSAFWKWLKDVASASWKWVSDKMKGAYNAIKGVWGKLYGFFKGVWDKIVGLFKNVGTRVGDAVGGKFKSVINSILNGAASIINGFIDAINGAVGTINKVPGVDISKISRLEVPQLAKGGIITAPTLAMIGEGGQSEAVIPLDKLESMMGGSGTPVNVNIDGETLLSFVIKGVNNKSFMTNDTVIEV